MGSILNEDLDKCGTCKYKKKYNKLRKDYDKIYNTLTKKLDEIAKLKNK